MTEQMAGYLFIVISVLGALNLVVMPIITQLQLSELAKKISELTNKVEYLQVCIDVIDINVRGDDPDPDDGEEVIEYDNVVAIGRKANAA